MSGEAIPVPQSVDNDEALARSVSKLEGRPYPSFAARWTLVGVFATAYILSYIDRYAPAVLIDGIKASLDITDKQAGFVIGFGFAAVYAVVALPISHFIDKYNRRWLAAAGLLIWSTCTILSGFASTFIELLILRGGVAVGEAVILPGFISLIGDAFPPEERALPIAMKSCIGSFMTTGAILASGAALAIAQGLAVHTSGYEPWRLTLMIVGIPGFILAFLMVTITREPVRRERTQKSEVADTTAFLRFLRKDRLFFIPYFVTIGFSVAAGYGYILWMPSLLVREHGYITVEASRDYGLVTTPVAAAATFFWVFVHERLAKGGRRDAPMLVLFMGACIALPAMLTGALAASTAVSLGASAFVSFGLGSISPMIAMVVNVIGPNRMRARLMATSLFSTGIMGLAGGVMAVPFVAGLLPQDGEQLGRGLALVGAIALGLSLILVSFARRRMVLIARAD